MKRIKYIWLCAMALSLSSCHLYKKYELPVENPYVNTFDKSMKEAENDSTSLPFLSWEQVFTDSVLQKYIRIALEQNKDIDNAVKNIEIAHAQLKGAKLSYYPSVALNPNGGASKYGNARMDKWTYTVPLSISWEADIFAKILNKKRGAEVYVEQMEDYLQAVKSQIVCSVASCYYSLMLLHQQLELAQRTSEIWKDQVETMRLMKLAGRVTEAAVVQSDANYWSVMASIPDIKESIYSLENTLSLLLHSYPNRWEVSDNMDFSLPVSIADGVPMSYLAARPDVRAAERSLASAYYNTTSARAAFYPGLTISLNGGFTDLLGSVIYNPGKFFLQLAGSLTAPIFSRGVNIANLEVAVANQKKAMNDFETTVLSASADVSDALASYKFNSEKREYVMKQIDDLEKSVEYTRELMQFDKSTTYLEMLTARSSLLSAQISSLTVWHNKVSALIALYQAVGGGR